MKYQIWQIENIKAVDYAFRSWDEAKDIFDINHYRSVYEGTMGQKNILENLYVKFNIDRPVNFVGHSLSVSDVVALKKDGNDYWYWYYCDDFGWKEITEIVLNKKEENE